MFLLTFIPASADIAFLVMQLFRTAIQVQDAHGTNGKAFVEASGMNLLNELMIQGKPN